MASGGVLCMATLLVMVVAGVHSGERSHVVCNGKLKVLVICAGYRSIGSTTGVVYQKCVYSSLSMKMVLNCVHILLGHQQRGQEGI